jgi:hypothetical protein
LNESSPTLGFERTRSPSTTVTATASTVTPFAVWAATGLAVGRGFDVAISDGVGVGVTAEAAPGVDDEGTADANEATEALQPAMRTTAQRSTPRRWRVMPPPESSGRSESYGFACYPTMPEGRPVADRDVVVP